MFGLYRTTLALLVVVGHIAWPNGWSNVTPGMYAVFGFYMLSGYLMTYIMHHTYGFTLAGRRRFVETRFLRIYPTYFIAIMLSLVLIATLGQHMTEFKTQLRVPSSLDEWARNLLLMMSVRDPVRLSPSAWAVTNELCFYALICGGVSKTPRRTRIWFYVSAAYTMSLVLSDAPLWMRYDTIAATSLPFATGAMIYHYRESLIQWLERSGRSHPGYWGLLLLCNYSVGQAAILLFNVDLLSYGSFYLNLVLAAGCTISLISWQPRHWSPANDVEIGRYSYPIYLLHWQVAGLVSYLSGGALGKTGFYTTSGLLFLCISLIVCVFVSHLMLRLVDQPIHAYRERIKRRGNT